MGFRQEDYTGDVATKLNCIILNFMGKNMLLALRDLTKGEQKKFQKELNEYVRNLPDDDWEDKITKDFNDLVCSDLMNANFKPEVLDCKIVNLTPMLLEKEETVEMIL
jgi:hypothetical protein